MDQIVVLASGALPAGGPAGMKLFVYGLEAAGAGGAAYLAQLLLLQDSREISAVVKTNNPIAEGAARAFVDTLVAALAPLGARP